MPDTDELTFKKGDIFFVHNDMGNGWLWVTAHRTGEQGMIFRELVEDLDDSIDPNTVFPWFHPNCTKNEAVDLLVKGKLYVIFIIEQFHDDGPTFINSNLKLTNYSWPWKLSCTTQ